MENWVDSSAVGCTKTTWIPSHGCAHCCHQWYSSTPQVTTTSSVEAAIHPCSRTGSHHPLYVRRRWWTTGKWDNSARKPWKKWCSSLRPLPGNEIWGCSRPMSESSKRVQGRWYSWLVLMGSCSSKCTNSIILQTRLNSYATAIISLFSKYCQYNRYNWGHCATEITSIVSKHC